MNPIVNLIPQFFDTDGQPLNAGYLYFGVASLNPETDPITVYWDAAGTQPAAQPIRTVNGYPSRYGTPGVLYLASSYSFTLRNKKGALVATYSSFVASSVSAAMSPVVSAATLADARTAMGAAASGANADITSLTALSAVPTVVATSISANTAQIQSISAVANTPSVSQLSVSSSALTLDFRSNTLTSGTVTRITGTPSNLVIPSGATLGTTSGQLSRIAVLAINYLGAIELAVVNTTGGNDLSETGLISTTAISAGSTAGNVVYSASARSSVAYRVVGYVESTQATAGTWATAPTTVQGAGGLSISAAGFGNGQTWQNVTGSRSLGVTYYNTTGKAIALSVYASGGAFNTLAYVNGQAIVNWNSNTLYVTPQLTLIVPPSHSYQIANPGGVTIGAWMEFRN